MSSKEFLKIAKDLERIKYQLDKMSIFNYDTLDEANPKQERIRGDLTVEIGGPRPHLKFGIMTRDEHTIIKVAVSKILADRYTKVKNRLAIFCKNYRELPLD